MKLTKAGEIEACCEWSDLEIRSGHIFIDKMFNILLTYIGVWNREWKAYDRENWEIKFCPNCGAKTEIEGEEKYD